MTAATRPVHESLFGVDPAGPPFLLGGECGACDRVQFPMASTCPACGSPEVAQVHLPTRGTLWGWTAVTAPPPGYLGTVPFGFGVVELDGGLRVITRIEEADPERLAFGMPMRLVVVELGSDSGADHTDVIMTYAFATDDDEVAQ